jgi:hypothetical protein
MHSRGPQRTLRIPGAREVNLSVEDSLLRLWQGIQRISTHDDSLRHGKGALPRWERLQRHRSHIMERNTLWVLDEEIERCRQLDEGNEDDGIGDLDRKLSADAFTTALGLFAPAGQELRAQEEAGLLHQHFGGDHRQLSLALR